MANHTRVDEQVEDELHRCQIVGVHELHQVNRVLEQQQRCGPLDIGFGLGKLLDVASKALDGVDVAADQQAAPDGAAHICDNK